MRAMDLCYVPGINALNDDHYIAHYSVDSKFNKSTWPEIDVSSFEENEFYTRVLEWMRHDKSMADAALPRG
jgi:hypothetical protein